MSVREDQLTGVGLALTLTLRHCPATSARWHQLRTNYEKRLRRMGMLRMHWVTEWQRRGVPHLHGAIWFPSDYVERHGLRAIGQSLTSQWVLLASEFGAGWKGQDCHKITGAVGWFQYVSKHAARGVRHYQRSPENIPEAWQSRTGRVWGKCGDWPVQEAMKFSLQDQHGDGGFFAFRRLVRSWRVADARASGDQRRIVSARGMLRCCDRVRSRIRGVMEWIPFESSLSLMANLAMRGYHIEQV